MSGLGEAERVFIDGMGVAAATSGVLTQTQGRIFAYIYLQDRPVSLDDICAALQVAKSNASVNVKALLEWQLVRRISVPGSRKDHYEGATDFWRVLQEIVERRFRWNLRQVTATVEETRRALEKGKASSAVRRKVEALGEFAAAIERGMAAFSSGEPWRPQEARRVATVASLEPREEREASRFGRGTRKSGMRTRR